VDPAFDVAIGLGLLTVVAAVAIRLGAIPAHAWAARVAEWVPAGAIPATLGWGAAGFGLVALGWIDVAIAPLATPLTMERGVVAVVASASVLLGGVAAVLHDDIEHVLGYSIVQDAGVTLLAFAAIRPEAAAAGRDWLVGIVAVKTGLAAWVLVTRSTFGVRRLSELGGWARSSPILGLALALVLLGAVGLPGMATFAARGVLTELALPAPFNAAVLLGAFAPIVYLGRILVVGLDRMSDASRAAQGARPRLRSLRPDGWTGTSLATGIRAVPVAIRGNRFVLAAGSAIVVAIIGLAVATGGLGATGSDQPVGGEPGANGTVQASEGA
jgi:NADH-quinone oxidoreductase subunit N